MKKMFTHIAVCPNCEAEVAFNPNDRNLSYGRCYCGIEYSGEEKETIFYVPRPDSGERIVRVKSKEMKR